MSVSWIERLWTNGLESESSHHRVEEDLQEHHMVSVGRLHDLNPLDGDLVLGSIVLSIVNWKISTLSETVDTSTPSNEKL